LYFAIITVDLFVLVGITTLAEKLPAFIVVTEFPVLSVIAINEPFPSSEFSLELGAVIYVYPACAIPDSPPNLLFQMQLFLSHFL